MNTNPVLDKILAAIMVIAILSGCSLNSAAPKGTAAPTSDQNLVNTQAAQTVAAVLTLNTPTAAPVTPGAATATPVAPKSSPTSAVSPTITPTRTPMILTIAPTYTPIYHTPTPTSTPNGYSCAITSTTPKSTASVKINTNFNWSWVIMNTGTAMWGQHNADLIYVKGKRMQTGADQYDLTQDVFPGDSYTATIPMKTPASAGAYNATWKIVQDGVLVCTLPLSVNVIN